MNKPIFNITILAVIIAFGLSACSDNGGGPDEPGPTNFSIEISNVAPINPVLKSGTFSSPGAGDLGPDNPALFPGESASFTFTVPPSTLTPVGGSGMRLNFATMFVQSNDLFYAFPREGLDLYDDQGNPTTGNVTDQLGLYDAGTEEDTAPGTGPDQKPAQDPMVTDQGPAEEENVSLVSQAASNDFTYPDKSEVIEVVIEHDGGVEFTVTVTNVSQPGTINSQRAGGSVPLSPGVWSVHEGALPFALFQTGEPASQGIEYIAEDGFVADMIDDGNIDTPIDNGLADVVAEITGVTTPLSPPVVAVHSDGFQAFTVGEAAGEGIETVAEDGFPADMLGGMDLPPTPDRALVDILEGEDEVSFVGAFPNPDGNAAALEPGPMNDGEGVELEISATPGDRLFLASMYVQSNDYFYGFGEEGLALFDSNGIPVSGNITGQVVLYDAGTEVDEEPGVGLTQKLRQGATAEDVGTEEGGVITPVVTAGANGGTDDGFSYPQTAQIIQITITPEEDDADNDN